MNPTATPIPELGAPHSTAGALGSQGEQQICTKTLTGVCSVICSPLEQHSERDSTAKAVPLAPDTRCCWHLAACGKHSQCHGMATCWVTRSSGGHKPQVSAACSSLQTKTLCWHLPEPGFPWFLSHSLGQVLCWHLPAHSVPACSG